MSAATPKGRREPVQLTVLKAWGRKTRIETAIASLRIARATLRDAGSHKAADYVQRSIKSAEGALRHAENLELRAQRAARSES
jgi:hypothetical protein